MSEPLDLNNLVDSISEVEKSIKIDKDDKYTKEILTTRYEIFKNSYIETDKIIKMGIPIRHQTMPEDISENIAKFIIQNYEGDLTCKWAKCIGMNGDLYSEKYDIKSPPEIKAFTSKGPSSFGPKKKFSVIYFLDMRNWIEDKLVLWKVNLTNESEQWKSIKVNKKQTNEEQCSEGRRPHIGWDKLHPQISEHCSKIYEGSFEDIFTIKQTKTE